MSMYTAACIVSMSCNNGDQHAVLLIENYWTKRDYCNYCNTGLNVDMIWAIMLGYPLTERM